MILSKQADGWLIPEQTRQTGLPESCGFSGEIGKLSEGLATSGMDRPVRRTIHPNLINYLHLVLPFLFPLLDRSVLL